MDRLDLHWKDFSIRYRPTVVNSAPKGVLVLADFYVFDSLLRLL